MRSIYKRKSANKWIIVIGLLLFSSARCQPIGEVPIGKLESAGENVDSEIYFVAQVENKLEIWRFHLRDTVEPLPYNTFYSNLIWYPASALPPMEQAILSNCTGDYREDCSLPTVPIEHNIDGLAPSSDHRYISWRDSLVHCPDADCVGQSRIILWDLEKNEEKILLEVPKHITTNLSQVIDDISWSHNGQFIAYVLKSNVFDLSPLNIINIATKEFNNISEGVYSYSWAPVTDRIAYTGEEYIDNRWRVFVKIIGMDDLNTSAFYEDWSDIHNLSWSPDEKQIATIAKQNETGQWRLFIIDLEQKTITEKTEIRDNQILNALWSPVERKIAIVNDVDGSIQILDVDTDTRIDVKKSLTYKLGRNPSWSPDGKILAVNTYPIEGITGISNGIAFIDVQDGEVVELLDYDGMSEEWIWTTSSDAIVFDLANKQLSCPRSEQHGLGLFNWRDGVIKPLLFHFSVMDALSSCKVIIKEIVR